MKRHTISSVWAGASAGLLLLTAAHGQLPLQSVTRVPKAEIQRHADEIDRILATALAAREATPNPVIDDATFVRRAYLQIVGRIPTAAESEAFLASRERDKRTALVDRLLDSPGHFSHEFHFWADLLRARTRLQTRVSGEPFLQWIKESLLEDEPYDEMVYQMLTAAGPAHQRDNGATGYLMRDLEMPEDSMSNTLRVFAGTRMECAQCHNHPFDKWTQKQFFEMAAFSGGIRYRLELAQTDAGRKLGQLRTEMLAEHGREAQRAVQQLLLPASLGLTGTGTGLVRLPNDYQYEDAKPNQPVVAKSAFGDEADLHVRMPTSTPRNARPVRGRANRAPLGPEVGSRQAFADWLISPENPRFALVIANRMWKRVAGAGLIEPVDDLKDDTVAVVPELMDHLARMVVQLRYDLRQFQRVLFHTQFFQREVAAADGSEGNAFLPVGPQLRRLSAEQIWDSMMTLVLPDLDATLAPPGARAEEVYRNYERVLRAEPEELRAMIEETVLRFTKPEEYRAMLRERQTVAQKQRQEERAELQRRAGPLLRQLSIARQKGDDATVQRLLAELRKLGADIPGERRRNPAQFARASDLPSPAPASHLLQMLGQSDRDQVDNANLEANVPQVLTLLNGFLDERPQAQRSGGVLDQLLAAAKTPDDKVRTAYLSLLSRKPTAAELTLWRAELQRGEDGLRDLVWVLLNSHEFRFLR